MYNNSQKINIVFFGTSEFAAIILEHLANTKHLVLTAVVTQPNKRTGRKKELTSSPVKILAQNYKLPILQPIKLDHFFLKQLKKTPADLFIIAAYGKIIPDDIINLPPYKTINVHPSLLPYYRGPAPIQYALLNGDTHTGVSIMLIDTEIDHGPIINSQPLAISDQDNYITLSKKLAEQSAKLLIKTVANYITKKTKPQPQKHTQATFSKIINKKDGLITPDKTSSQIYNMWRAYISWPGIYLKSQIKLLDITLVSIKHKHSSLELFTKNNNLYLACADKTTIQINSLHPAGKKPMSAKNFINGYINKTKF